MSQVINFSDDDQDIAKYEVSEDGVMWRPYDPVTDHGRLLHKRIEFTVTPPSARTSPRPADRHMPSS